MMINRDISYKFSEISKQVPIVTIIGPRQSDKTTLLKKCFKEYNYVNLEDQMNRMLAKEDYIGFF
ncbi:AAA family ATPase [Lagierella sp.]|uniref:AAA family ATPase n=1 Tax=Lagierella sp. TaxID=2849657 RepID=UPI00260F3EDF|nr:AAA family ATPase [Lagierella sp.]